MKAKDTVMNNPELIKLLGQYHDGSKGYCISCSGGDF